jgi:hypothetical protein
MFRVLWAPQAVRVDSPVEMLVVEALRQEKGEAQEAAKRLARIGWAGMHRSGLLERLNRRIGTLITAGMNRTLLGKFTGMPLYSL